MSVPHIISSFWLSVCQKLSNLVWRFDENELGHFLAHPVHRPCTIQSLHGATVLFLTQTDHIQHGQ